MGWFVIPAHKTRKGLLQVLDSSVFLSSLQIETDTVGPPLNMNDFENAAYMGKSDHLLLRVYLT